MQKYTYKQKIMGTYLDIGIYTNTAPNDIVDTIYKELTYYESIFSRFDPTSTLSQLNKTKKIQVPDIFLEVLDYALYLHQITDGYFNPLLSPAHLGYDIDWQKLKITKNIEIKNTKPDTDISKIHIDRNTNTISINKNQNLDFGGFLKGWASKETSKYLTSYPAYYISIGGDITASGKEKNGEDMTFSILDPNDENLALGIISISNTSLATSGSTRRHWQAEGKNYHHILDSQTGTSSQSDIAMATIVAPDGGLADGIATVCVASGLEKTKKILEKLNLSGLILMKNGNIEMIGEMQNIYQNLQNPKENNISETGFFIS